jgi:hypothetical protein
VGGGTYKAPKGLNQAAFGPAGRSDPTAGLNLLYGARPPTINT